MVSGEMFFDEGDHLIDPNILHFGPEHGLPEEFQGFWRRQNEPTPQVIQCLRVVPRVLPTVHWVDESHPAWDERRPKVRVFRVACDFDEVIHQGMTLFTTPTEIADPPFPGAFEWIRGLLDAGVTFIVHTCRLTGWSNSNPYLFHARGDEVEAALRAWFLRHGLEARYVDLLHFWHYVGKPSADVYIDDKAWRFHGIYPSVPELQAEVKGAEEDRARRLRAHEAMVQAQRAVAYTPT